MEYQIDIQSIFGLPWHSTFMLLSIVHLAKESSQFGSHPVGHKTLEV